MTIIPPSPIRSQCAWLRQDLESNQSWIHSLSRRELAELEMFGSDPEPDAVSGGDDPTLRDFWSFEGEFLTRHHVVPRSM